MEQNIRYLTLLAQKYPNKRTVAKAIICLQAICHLPKPTEHFMSDLHGEAEAFMHILNNASGAVRKKVDTAFQDILSDNERAQLSTLIYYPREKLANIAEHTPLTQEWFRVTLNRLIEICRLCATKYTRDKIGMALPAWNGNLINELISQNRNCFNKQSYFDSIIETIIKTGYAEDFICSMSDLIKRLVVDRLHIVGDIFDRGPRADIILDLLEAHHSVDIQWGNHDVLWMGAALGSRACIATVLSNSISYCNLEVLETGYGISLRELALFADEVYKNSDISCFLPKNVMEICDSETDILRMARMNKAITIIQFKLEGQLIRRNPSFHMEDRMMLDKMDLLNGVVHLNSGTFPLRDTDFPTIQSSSPYVLSPEESALMEQLRDAFQNSEKLQRHIHFLYSKGGLYKCYNGNLLYHGCVPMNEDGEFLSFHFGKQDLSGKDLIDFCEKTVRQGYEADDNTVERQYGKDLLWFLWCGRNSPLFGRDHIATFERKLVQERSTWQEPQNSYYTYYNRPDICNRILNEFGLSGEHCHIINGHIPVKTKKGESPIKAEGKLIVIDGGFCRAYQPTTGIAGYTLIYDSWGIHISAHEPFAGKQNAILENKDILSTSKVFDRRESRIRVGETDEGRIMKQKIKDLTNLLTAYRNGDIEEETEEI